MHSLRIDAFIRAFKGKKIGVVGDVMLDRFIFGDSERISPEAPVPVVSVSHTLTSPGGAGNVAQNIAALGGKAFLVGIIGDDSAGEELCAILKKKKVNREGLLVRPRMQTNEKVRVIARGQHMLRIDREHAVPPSPNLMRKIFDFLKTQIAMWDMIIVTDYAKGLVSEGWARTFMAIAREAQCRVIIDAKPRHIPYFKGAYCGTPNTKEAQEVAHTDDTRAAGKKIQRLLNSNVLITRGAEGMDLFERGKKMRHIAAHAREVYDVAGAGDTVAAVLALASAAGASLYQAAVLANCAAGIVVGKVGTAAPTLRELREESQKIYG